MSWAECRADLDGSNQPTHAKRILYVRPLVDRSISQALSSQQFLMSFDAIVSRLLSRTIAGAGRAVRDTWNFMSVAVEFRLCSVTGFPSFCWMTASKHLAAPGRHRQSTGSCWGRFDRRIAPFSRKITQSTSPRWTAQGNAVAPESCARAVMTNDFVNLFRIKKQASL